jgi:arylsulfatase A-like enzyme
MPRTRNGADLSPAIRCEDALMEGSCEQSACAEPRRPVGGLLLTVGVVAGMMTAGSGGTKGEQCYNNTTDQSCHVPAIVIAPSVEAGTVVSTQFSHYSLLKTADQLLGLGQLGQTSSASSMKAPGSTCNPLSPRGTHDCSDAGRP